MKRHHIFSFFMFLFLLHSLTSFMFKTPGSPVASTGAPNEGTCGKVACHDDAPILDGAGINQFIILNQDIPKYEPGQWFNFRIAINRSGHDKFGFQAVALREDTEENVGEWFIYQPNRTQILHNANINNRYYVTHKADGTGEVAPGRGAWQMEWKAPENNVGNLSFYYATVASNHDGTRLGDTIFISNYTIAPFSTNVTEQEHLTMNIFPNPAEQVLNVEAPDLEGAINISITDLAGKIIFSEETIANNGELQIVVDFLAAGTYLLKIEKDGKEGVERFLKM